MAHKKYLLILTKRYKSHISSSDPVYLTFLFNSWGKWHWTTVTQIKIARRLIRHPTLNKEAPAQWTLTGSNYRKKTVHRLSNIFTVRRKTSSLISLTILVVKQRIIKTGDHNSKSYSESTWPLPPSCVTVPHNEQLNNSNPTYVIKCLAK